MHLGGRNGLLSSVVHSFNLLTNYSQLDHQQCSIFICLRAMTTTLTSLNASRVNVSERWRVMQLNANQVTSFGLNVFDRQKMTVEKCGRKLNRG
jgi:hypothetical protein